MAQNKVVLPEYLGDIDPELLLQNLTNTNPVPNIIPADPEREKEALSTIDELRYGFPELKKRGSVLTAVAGYDYEWEGDPNGCRN